MAEQGHKIVEVIGSTSQRIEDAIRAAVARANDSLDNLEWFEVTEAQGLDDDDARQLVMRLGFSRHSDDR